MPPTAAGSYSSLGASAASWGPAVGVWEQLRVLEYTEGDFFLPHRDHACEVGQSTLHPFCRSFFSLLLYLEDSVDGCGATRFYLDAEPPQDDADDPRARAMRQHDRPSGGVVVADVVPMAGRVCVFPHRLLHESMAITPGMRKCVVRGDVLYGQGA